MVIHCSTAIPVLLVVAILSSFVSCYAEIITGISNDQDYYRCNGMYSRSSIPGAAGQGTISLLVNYVHSSTSINILIFDSRDQDLVLHPPTNQLVICGTADTIKSGACPESDKGKVIVNTTSSHPPTSAILNELHHFNAQYLNRTGTDVVRFSYQVNTTGFYCVAAMSMQNIPFIATVEWENPYGQLPAIEYPKLPFYGFLSIIFMIIGVTWMVLSFKHSNELLPIQLWTTAVTLFIVTEMAFNYAYYEDWNRYGRQSAFLLVLVIVLNAARNSLSFFMLLVVSLGYGVVKPTLGTTMSRCIALGVLHFLSGVIYMVGAQVLSEITPFAVLMFVLPLSITMTAFYFWILSALSATMKRLELRRQSVKLEMYRNLWRILLASVIVLSIFFIVNAVNVSYRESPSWMPHYWQWKWFLLEGWLNILYLFVYIGILILWRPTTNNARYGLEQISSQDDDDEAVRVEGGVSDRRVKLRATKANVPAEENNDDDDDDDNDDNLMDWVEKHVNGTNGEASGASQSGGQILLPPTSPDAARLVAEEASKRQ
ncbi:hypothetical protein SeMB42_g03850 [Synchytrium endobioticum]|uniref:Uncharacterized protein n=1 Tax=Synchytrium endobioticum TaxID=286115 RepID=A0A507D3E9_9FUNG|nr:hypothetical protein SeLEV6574_g06972 [Synchytrium endobioticum]TPX45954.1 hypothetical protein SeMB42_g03850 [Synchytrium endobioticum]